jgi:sulfur-oxidizing protein SoxY
MTGHDSARRQALAQTVGWPLALRATSLVTSLGAVASAPAGASVAAAQGASYRAAVLAFTGGAWPLPGRVRLDVAVLVDNGNTVPIVVSVEQPAGELTTVRSIAVFSEGNPQHEVLRFQLGSGNSQAEIESRIRLATSQKLIAVAELSDGRFWSQEVEVIVTLAACIETDD